MLATPPGIPCLSMEGHISMACNTILCPSRSRHHGCK
jgi:hypothetical protein